MPRPYEIVYIFDSALEEADINAKLERFHAQLKTPEHPEPVTAVSHWGKRTLAYPIGRNEVGYYVVVQFDADTAVLPEFQRLLKLDESLLRHLVVVNDGLQPVPAAPPVDREPGKVDDSEEDDE